MHILTTLRLALRYKTLLLVVLLVPPVLAGVFAMNRTDTYTTSIAFTVNRINKQPKPD